jgi:class 3 adenylate cyclase
MDDVRAVMDAAGSHRAALVGLSEGGPMSILFAATYPERTAALVLWGTFARVAEAPDYPFGGTPEIAEATYGFIREKWGTGRVLERVSLQDVAPDEAIRATLGRAERNASSPGAAVTTMRFGVESDVRHVLPAIRVPTLVAHRTGDPLVAIEHGRYLAANIPGARLLELPGDFHVGGTPGCNDALFDEIEEFLTGTRTPRPVEVDRVLVTILFTDIVGSTERAAALGDRRWRELLDAHDAVVRQALATMRGRELKTTGDGFLAAFDGPARAIRCAKDITAGARRLGLDVRAGLHTGECEVRGDDLTGLAVHIGARTAAIAGPGEVLLTRTVHDLVAGAGFEFDDRGEQELRGVPGRWHVYAAR